MNYAPWPNIQKRFIEWWDGNLSSRPLMRVIARDATSTVQKAEKPEGSEQYLDVHAIVAKYRTFLANHHLMADAYPNASFDLGPGSMALYLGSEPKFTPETVWFTECVHDGWEKFGPLQFDPQNVWWKTHLQMIQTAVTLSKGDFIVNIPDIIENVDILAAMRGPQAFIFDLIDTPSIAKARIGEIDKLYFTFYDAMRELTVEEDGGCSFTAFQVWGPGKTAKVQCDFCALMSPSQFREFVQPSLSYQCSLLDHSVYHLDGPDAIKHLDALMEIESLNALQWTCGAGQPDGGHEGWYTIYDRVQDARKSLHISLYDGEYEDWKRSASKLVERYGPSGLYFLFPVMEIGQAEELIQVAERDWSA